MRVGWLGLGKLGMPCALALTIAGHEVVGYDPAPAIAAAVEASTWPHDEPGVEALLEGCGRFFRLAYSLEEACADAELVMVAVQTPHGTGYDGSVPMPEELMPFDTLFLRAAVMAADAALSAAGNPAPLVVVSTVLPGTCRLELEPLLGGRPYVYNPAFVAMGTVLADLREPEFVLAGTRHPDAAELLGKLYAHVDAPLLTVGVESAELAKMAYNTAITSKIVLANAVMELAHATGANADEVAGVLEQATARVASGRYMRGGMGDGGPCHPRDAIAMAWLARRVALSADPFGFAVRAREAQAEWLARTVAHHAEVEGLPVAVAGRAYKTGVSIETGSAALLVGHYLAERGIEVRWLEDGEELAEPAVVLLALPDRNVFLPAGSLVVDPWGVLDGDLPMVVSVGR